MVVWLGTWDGLKAFGTSEKRGTTSGLIEKEKKQYVDSIAILVLYWLSNSILTNHGTLPKK